MFKKVPEDVIKFKKQNVSPGKAKEVAGIKRRYVFTNADSEDEENSELPKKQRRQIRSATRLQTVTRNSKDNSNWLGGF